MIAASTTARASSNKALIKKVVGLLLVAVVCVTVVVVVLKVLKTFGGSDDDKNEENKFEGMLGKNPQRAECTLMGINGKKNERKTCNRYQLREKAVFIVALNSPVQKLITKYKTCFYFLSFLKSETNDYRKKESNC